MLTTADRWVPGLFRLFWPGMGVVVVVLWLCEIGESWVVVVGERACSGLGAMVPALLIADHKAGPL